MQNDLICALFSRVEEYSSIRRYNIDENIYTNRLPGPEFSLFLFNIVLWIHYWYVPTIQQPQSPDTNPLLDYYIRFPHANAMLMRYQYRRCYQGQYLIPTVVIRKDYVGYNCAGNIIGFNNGRSKDTAGNDRVPYARLRANIGTIMEQSWTSHGSVSPLSIKYCFIWVLVIEDWLDRTVVAFKYQYLYFMNLCTLVGHLPILLSNR